MCVARAPPNTIRTMCVSLYAGKMSKSKNLCEYELSRSSIRHEISQNAINLWIVVLQLSKNIHNNAAPTDDSVVSVWMLRMYGYFVGEFNCDRSHSIQSFHWCRKCSSFGSFYVHSYVVRDECERREWIDSEHLLLEKSCSKIGGQKSTFTLYAQIMSRPVPCTYLDHLHGWRHSRIGKLNSGSEFTFFIRFNGNKMSKLSPIDSIAWSLQGNGMHALVFIAHAQADFSEHTVLVNFSV